MNANTIPVVIQDKNGKTTTVHKKLVSETSAGNAIPAPDGGKSRPETMGRGEAVEAFVRLGVKLNDNTQINLQYLSDRRPALLKTLVDTIEAADSYERNIWGEALQRSAYVPDDDDDEPNAALHFYHRFIHSIPLGAKLYPDEGDSGRALYKIKSLTTSCEGKIGWKPHQKQYREVKAAMIAVAVSGNEYSFDYKGRMDDIFWMADHLEDVEPFIPELMGRKDSSRGYVEALMENKAAALTSGLL